MASELDLYQLAKQAADDPNAADVLADHYEETGRPNSAHLYREKARLLRGEFRNITEIKEANKNAGGHFFDKDTMRLFHSRILPKVYGGKYFITAERGREMPRWGHEAGSEKYTIREVSSAGDISTVGSFQGFDGLEEAHEEIYNLIGGKPRQRTRYRKRKSY